VGLTRQLRRCEPQGGGLSRVDDQPDDSFSVGGGRESVRHGLADCLSVQIPPPPYRASVGDVRDDDVCDLPDLLEREILGGQQCLIRARPDELARPYGGVTAEESSDPQSRALPNCATSRYSVVGREPAASASDPQSDAGVRDENSCPRVQIGAFVCDEDVLMLLRVGDEQVVSVVARERGDRCLCEAARFRPCCQRCEVLCRCLVDRVEEVRVLLCPLGKLILASEKFIAYCLDAAGERLVVGAVEPGPESGGDVEGVVAVFASMSTLVTTSVLTR